MAAFIAAELSLLFLSAAAINVHRAPTPDALYFWPEPRGQPGAWSTSMFTAPRNLTRDTLSWSWFNGGPKKKYSRAAHSGLVLDAQQNIYLSSTDGIRKFDGNGRLLWHAPMTTWRIPTLYDGKVYVTDNNGTALGLSMETGRTLRAAKYTTALGSDISGVAVCEGVLLCESRGNPGGGAAAVAALDPQSGRLLWEFNTDSQLWNFMPMCSGKGSFVFQDQIGGVYHVGIKDGRRLWKAGYSGAWAADMTDGMAMLADGVVYAVHSDGPLPGPRQAANLRAYALETGAQLWKQDFPYPANSQPAVGYLGRGPGLSEHLAVVMPIGAQAFGTATEFHSAVKAFHAKTGSPLWEWTPPVWKHRLVAGDFKRVIHGNLCIPNPYGSPSIDARGTVYLGYQNGMIYAIRDDNGDDIIQDSEVSEFDTGAGFSHGGAVIAPGMLAIPSCDGLFVFRE